MACEDKTIYTLLAPPPLLCRNAGSVIQRGEHAACSEWAEDPQARFEGGRMWPVTSSVPLQGTLVTIMYATNKYSLRDERRNALKYTQQGIKVQTILLRLTLVHA